jgi:ABC-type phosphate/phosphonate transport system substrate-binding protein
MPRPLIAACLASGLAIGALPAAAQNALERLEMLDERMNAAAFAALEAEYPALSGYMPSPEWNDDLRSSWACLLDEVEARTGSDGVEEFLGNYAETVDAAASGQSDLLNMSFAPPEGMSQNDFQSVYVECGIWEAIMARYQESGAAAILMESGQ